MTAPLTPAAAVERVKELDRAATPGPWQPEPRDMAESGEWRVRIGSDGGNDGVYVAHALGKSNKPNAAFIAESRTLLPVLAAEVERQAGEIERLRAVIHWMNTNACDWRGEGPKGEIAETIERACISDWCDGVDRAMKTAPSGKEGA